jgi:hypothetical protein
VKRTCQLNFANDRLDFDWKEAYTPRYVIGLWKYDDGSRKTHRISQKRTT